MIEYSTESALYNSLKRGHKTAIGIDLNDMCRNYLIDNEWVYGDDTVEFISKKVMSHYFLKSFIESSSKEELKELENFFNAKVSISLNKFKFQEATVAQVYRYVKACLKVDEAILPIYSNHKIWTETNRLEKLWNEKNKQTEEK